MVYIVRLGCDYIAYCITKGVDLYEFKIQKIKFGHNDKPIFDLTEYEDLKFGYVNIEKQCLIYDEYVCCNIQSNVFVLNMITNTATKITNNVEKLCINKDKIIIKKSGGKSLDYFTLQNLKLTYFCDLSSLAPTSKEIFIVDYMSIFKGYLLLLLTDYDAFYVTKIHIDNNECKYIFKIDRNYIDGCIARVVKLDDGIYVYLDKDKYFYEYVDDISGLTGLY